MSQTRSQRPRNAGYRVDLLWNAALIHRLSGVALAVFLPLHFLVLGLTLKGESTLDGFLAWTRQPLVKFAEAGLVFCLAVHLIGGVRVLMIETYGWTPGQRAFVTAGLVTATALAFLFLLTA